MLEAYRRGDRAALHAAFEAAWPPIWRIARRGFLISEAGERLWVEGEEDPDRLEGLVVQVLGELAQPGNRAALQDMAALGQAGLLIFRRRRLSQAQRLGRVVSVHDPKLVPPQVEDLDALISSAAAPSELGPAPSLELERLGRDGASALQVLLGQAGTALVEVHKLRFLEGKSRAETAVALGVGKAAVDARVRRLRHGLTRALRASGAIKAAGQAQLDALLAGVPLELLPPAITRERLLERACSMSTIAEPRPFGVRLGYALAVLAAGAVLFALMYQGVLPGPDQDRSPEPSAHVTCKAACAAGDQLSISVLAPRRSRDVALFLISPDQIVPLAVAPGGASLSLPFGAKQQATALPGTYTLAAPLDPNARIAAIFSDKRLGPSELARIARGAKGNAHVVWAQAERP